MPRRPVPPPASTDESPDSSPDLRSRTDARKERLATEEGLMKLSEKLVSCGDAVLAKLDLPDDALDAIRGAQRVRPGAARNRALRLVRSTLRDADFEVIRQKLLDVHGGPGPRQRRDGG